MYTEKDHTFVVCAYKENPHLEESIISLEKQTVKSTILLATSTPNDHIKDICEKHNLKMYVNPHPVSIGGDWNYAYSRAKTELVTIVHQDDIYEPDYLKNILKYVNKRKNDDVIIVFTDYYELRPGNKKVITNKLLKIKRLMMFPLSLPFFYSSRFVRRRILSMGNPICCPSVTLVKKHTGKVVFDTDMKNSCDYKAWVSFSKNKGAYIYINKKIMAHRVYPESTTTKNISEKIRQKEDLEILCEFWPRPVAKFINRFYSKSENSNAV